MKLTCLFLLSILFPTVVNAGDYTRGLTIWFDTPNSPKGRAIWYGGKPDIWTDENKPESAGDTTENPDSIWESRSLPIGNGSMGANITGSIEAERITFNEKTLWRGGPNTAKGAEYYWNVNKQSAHILKEIRQAFIEGNQEKAAMLTRKNFNSEVPYESYKEKPFRFGNFTTMGEFYIETGLKATGISDYKRILSLDSAVAIIRFIKDSVTYERRSFISYPDDVMVMRFTANVPGKQNLILNYSPNPVSTGKLSADGIYGLVYMAHLDNNGMKYVVRMHANIRGGKLTNTGKQLIIEKADEVIFYVTADTDYKINFDPDFSDPKAYTGENPAITTKQWMKNALACGYETLFKQHYDDYSSLFNRVRLNINPETEHTDIPVNKRLQKYRTGVPDFYLEELYYQFGRYLLISSSRPGNMPANLQGIWHNNVDGPWRVDYHNNVNVQMNYWLAGTGNLAECTLPLIDFIRTLVKPGEITAQSYFGARGWTASVSGNIFGFTTPLESEDMSWNFSPMAGPWLCTHLWDYYDYTRDKKFLRETGYDLLKSSANFAVDYLWHKPDGTYTAAPSTSPEHGPIDQGATFVHAVIREILLNAIEAGKVLGVDGKARKEWKNVLKNLAPFKIGRYGQLMEWSTDIDDPKNEHRHVNHLFGLHPGHTISPVNTPGLAEAAKVVLEHRGNEATGWSMAWKLNLWARLYDGNQAYTLLGNLLKTGTLDNLWNTNPVFQIDGNLGGSAGIAEMLLQSHLGFIHLLPALPDAWKNGNVSGLCARGNFVVDITWTDNQLTKVSILSKSGGHCIIRYKSQILSFKSAKGKYHEFKYENDHLIRM